MESEAGDDPRARAALAWCREWLGQADLRLEPAAADASARRYFRVLDGDGGSRVVMAARGQRPAVAAFVRIAGLLHAAGVHAPEVLASDLERGFLLLTDLGRESYLDALSAGRAPEPLYDAALASLVRWQAATRPGRLPAYDERLLHAELDLFVHWYLGRHCGVEPGGAQRRRLEQGLAQIVARCRGQAAVYVHRDYMPRNLMVAAPQPGVLDFQDAVLGPVSYDPVCLFRDAFLSWPQGFVRDGLQQYWERARAAGLPVPAGFARFWADCQWMGVQRHLKVLGIFARLRYRDGKPRYLEDRARFIGYLRAAAEAEPGLEGVVGEILALAGEGDGCAP